MWSPFKDVELGTGSAKVPVPPLRFNNHYVGPRTGAYGQGNDNRKVLKERLAMDDAEVDALESDKVLITGGGQGKSRFPV